LPVSSFVDSKQRELSPEEICKIAAKETGGKYSVDQIQASLMAEAYEAGALMLRQGNTIFIVHPFKSNPRIVLFRAVNADTIQNYFQNSLEFTKAMGLAGFQYMVTDFEDERLLNIFKYIKRNQPFPKMGYAIQRQKNGWIRVTVNLGETGHPPLKLGEEE
jgi:hypothetical protein